MKLVTKVIVLTLCSLEEDIGSTGSWRIDSVVKSTLCSCRGPESRSQDLSQVVHNCLQFQLQGI